LITIPEVLPLARILKAHVKTLGGVVTVEESQTKYLESYLGWMRLLDRDKSITAKQLLGVISGRNLMYQPLMRS